MYFCSNVYCFVARLGKSVYFASWEPLFNNRAAMSMTLTDDGRAVDLKFKKAFEIFYLLN